MLSEDQLSFVALADQYFLIHGRLFNAKEAAEYCGLPAKAYNNLLSTPKVQDALRERGIDLGSHVTVGKNFVPAEEAWKHKALTPQQLMIANEMLDLIDTRSHRKKLQDANITPAQWARWLKDPGFQSYLRMRAESMLGENQHEAHLALLDKVRSGDMKALAMYYEMTGIFTPAANKGTNAASVQIDVQNLLVRIIEILQDEITDSQTMIRVAERIKQLATARTIAGELVDSGEPISVPSIAKARELTPELTALMNSGEGFE